MRGAAGAAALLTAAAWLPRAAGSYVTQVILLEPTELLSLTSERRIESWLDIGPEYGLTPCAGDRIEVSWQNDVCNQRLNTNHKLAVYAAGEPWTNEYASVVAHVRATSQAYVFAAAPPPPVSASDYAQILEPGQLAQLPGTPIDTTCPSLNFTLTPSDVADQFFPNGSLAINMKVWTECLYIPMEATDQGTNAMYRTNSSCSGTLEVRAARRPMRLHAYALCTDALGTAPAGTVCADGERPHVRRQSAARISAAGAVRAVAAAAAAAPVAAAV